MTSGLIPVPRRTLTPAQYGELADVPPELEWLANITNPKTRRAYKLDVSEFSAFSGLSMAALVSFCARLEKGRLSINAPSFNTEPTQTGRMLLFARTKSYGTT